jgi:hypothetical protein
MAEELCNHCGAPRVAGYAACKFCKTPFVQNTQTGAIPCPRCNTLNEMGAQRCVQCQTWVVVQCVFCHALSPHNVPGCLKCGEPFAGAPQRLAERQRQQNIDQGLHIAGAVGNVAASFLGAAAGAGMFSHHEGYEHHYEHYHHGGYEGGGYAGGGGYEGGGYAGGGGYEGGSSGAGIAAVAAGAAGGGLLGSLLGSSSNSDEGAGLAQSNDQGGSIAESASGSTGGGFFDSLFGGSSDDSSSSSSSSDDSSDSGGFFGGDDS